MGTDDRSILKDGDAGGRDKELAPKNSSVCRNAFVDARRKLHNRGVGEPERTGADRTWAAITGPTGMQRRSPAREECLIEENKHTFQKSPFASWHRRKPHTDLIAKPALGTKERADRDLKVKVLVIST